MLNLECPRIAIVQIGVVGCALESACWQRLSVIAVN